MFKFVYSFADGEVPDAMYFKSNNITNAREQWKKCKLEDDVLLAIFKGGKEVWRSKVETGFQLSVVK